MRQIKFRAWDKNKQKMVYTDFLIRSNGDTSIFDVDSDTLYSTNGSNGTSFILMQFTGLLDKNGTEIWESDIVKCDEFRTYKVYWNKDRWGLKEGNGFDYDNGDYYQGDDINNWKEFEVIGNVFENQDILNQLKGGKC